MDPTVMPSQRSTFRTLGLSDLHLAVIPGHTRRVLAILRHQDIGELINARDVNGATPLMAAVLTGRLGIARLLLQHGAAARIKDRKGRTALDYSKSRLFKKKLDVYRRAGFPPLTPKQHRQRTIIARILRFPAALESWFVSLFPVPRFPFFFLLKEHSAANAKLLLVVEQADTHTPDWCSTKTTEI